MLEQIETMLGITTAITWVILVIQYIVTFFVIWCIWSAQRWARQTYIAVAKLNETMERSIGSSTSKESKAATTTNTGTNGMWECMACKKMNTELQKNCVSCGFLKHT